MDYADSYARWVKWVQAIMSFIASEVPSTLCIRVCFRLSPGARDYGRRVEETYAYIKQHIPDYKRIWEVQENVL